MGTAEKIDVVRPDIFQYLDVHEFLNDWVQFISTDTKQSLRKVATGFGIDHSHLSKLLNKNATLTPALLKKFSHKLGLNSDELQFLWSLRDLSESKTQSERIDAFKKILKDRRYRLKNQSDIIEHEYLSHWYYPVIRELAKLPYFSEDPAWIRKQLGRKITVSEARSAMHFLTTSGYINRDENGFSIPNRQVTCNGGVYRLAASEYHEQLLSIASESIHDVERDFRQIMSHTLAMEKSKVHLVRDILRNAVNEIKGLDMKLDDKDSVYQISLMAFPLTDVKVDKGGNDG